MTDSSEGEVVLTPQLQLAIRMLQGNHREMRGWIEEALRDNPALTWAPPETETEVDAEVQVEDGRLSVVLADEGVLSVDEGAEDSGKKSAEWLVSAAARRRRSIERLLEAMVAHQEGFLSGAEEAPGELSVTTLAGELGYHRSTVERLLKGKSLRICRQGSGEGSDDSEDRDAGEVIDFAALVPSRA